MSLEEKGFMDDDPEPSIFDDPELSPKETDFNNITWATPGDRFRGELLRTERIRTQYGYVAKFYMFDPEQQAERSFLAGAQDLWAQLHKLRPEIGDTLDIELMRVEGRRHIYNVQVESHLK
jgi:hypothetical protein